MLIGAPASITTIVFGLAPATVSTRAFWSSLLALQKSVAQAKPGFASSVVRSEPSDSVSPITTIATSAALAAAAASA